MTLKNRKQYYLNNIVDLYKQCLCKQAKRIFAFTILIGAGIVCCKKSNNTPVTPTTPKSTPAYIDSNKVDSIYIDSIVGIYVGTFNKHSTSTSGFSGPPHFDTTIYSDTFTVSKISNDSFYCTLDNSRIAYYYDSVRKIRNYYGVSFRYKNSNSFVYYFYWQTGYYDDTTAITFSPNTGGVIYDYYYFDPGGAGGGVDHETFSGIKIK